MFVDSSSGYVYATQISLTALVSTRMYSARIGQERRSLAAGGGGGAVTRVTRGLAEWRRVPCQLSRGPACQLPDNGIPADNAGTQGVKTDLSSTLAHNGDHFCHYLKNRMI